MTLGASMHTFLRASLLLYLLATLLGVLLRYALVAPVPFLTFGNALHAHSHTLYFGWAALALFTLFFERVGASDGPVRWTLWSIIALALATFGTFLHSGYKGPGVVVSSLSLLVWGAAVTLFLRRAKTCRTIDVTFLRVAVAYVVIAGLSAATRVVLLVLKVENPLFGALAVFSFLHAFGAFFGFGLMGLLARFLAERGAPLDERSLRWQLGFMTPLSALTFPLGVPGGMGSFLGPTARLAAALLLIPSALWVWNLGRASGKLPAAERLVLRTLVLAWALEALLEAAGALGLAEAAARARHPAILYLHVELLGVITAGLLFLVRQKLGRTSASPLLLHQAGVGVMALGLGLAGAPAMLGWQTPVVAGLWAAAAGGVLVVGAGLWVAVEVLPARGDVDLGARAVIKQKKYEKKV